MKFVLLFSLLLTLQGCASHSKSIHLADWTKSDEITVLEHEKMSEEDAHHLVQEKIKMMDALLRPTVDPYFGKRDPGPNCTESKLPARVHVSEKNFFSEEIFLYATAAHVYGICNPELENKKSQILWLYCSQNQTLYELKYFYPASQKWVTQPVASCP
jgi:hypothetical protein